MEDVMAFVQSAELEQISGFVPRQAGFLTQFAYRRIHRGFFPPDRATRQ